MLNVLLLGGRAIEHLQYAVRDAGFNPLFEEPVQTNVMCDDSSQLVYATIIAASAPASDWFIAGRYRSPVNHVIAVGRITDPKLAGSVAETIDGVQAIDTLCCLRERGFEGPGEYLLTKHGSIPIF